MAKRSKFPRFQAILTRLGANCGPKTLSYREKRATAHMSSQMFSLDKCFELHIRKASIGSAVLASLFASQTRTKSKNIAKSYAIVNELSVVHQVIPA